MRDLAKAVRDLQKTTALIEVFAKAAQELRAEGDEQAAALAEELRQQVAAQAEQVRQKPLQLAPADQLVPPPSLLS